MIRVKYQDCYIDRSVVSAIVVGVQLYLSVVDRRTEMLAIDGVQTSLGCYGGGKGGIGCADYCRGG